MQNTIYIFTSFTEKENLLEALTSFQYTDDSEKISLPLLQAEIVDGDAYFLKQREGMLNFYSGVMNPDFMEIHSNFLMHLASCVKGYKLNFVFEQSITPLINVFVENMHALVFSPSMAFYTTNWQLIIDANGSCELTDYKVKMSAATFDSTIETDAENEHRKQETIAKLKALNIPVLESLPTVPSTSQVTYRSEEEVAKRILALAITAVKGELKTKDIPLQIFQKYQMSMEDVTHWEFNFINSDQPQAQDFVNAIWRYESLNTLMWACGYLDEMPFPSEIVNVKDITTYIRECRDFEDFLMNANMRDMDEILDELDLIYRLHWACVDARVNNLAPPEGIHPSVVYERHYALNWLIDRYNEDWDNVSTTT